MKAKQSGFTLIELVIVIVILGILAAVAAPRFMNVQNDAKISATKATLGSIRTGIAIAHGKILATGLNTGRVGTNPDWPTYAEVDANTLATTRPASVQSYHITETDATPGTATGQMPAVNLPDMTNLTAPRGVLVRNLTAGENRTAGNGNANGWAYYPGNSYGTGALASRLQPAIFFANRSNATNADGGGVTPNNW